ncbi:hypothetical protein [Nocardia sp. SYP-A9097]|uniref:hypothetical protein n=1 Tax=Nocardia sp. SYP-A9097 TaxID=2663237 RepID=UPI00129AC378|nr:hypothetical protein [Nocardia sp. SYP-A9097]
MMCAVRLRRRRVANLAPRHAATCRRVEKWRPRVEYRGLAVRTRPGPGGTTATGSAEGGPDGVSHAGIHFSMSTSHADTTLIRLDLSPAARIRPLGGDGS